MIEIPTFSSASWRATLKKELFQLDTTAFYLKHSALQEEMEDKAHPQPSPFVFLHVACAGRR